MKKISIDKAPYTIFGSYLIAKRTNDRLEIVNIHGWRGTSAFFQISCENKDILFEPGKLEFSHSGSTHQLTFYGETNCIIRGKGSLKLKYINKKDFPHFAGNPYDAAHSMLVDGKIFINDYKNHYYVWLEAVKGATVLDQKWLPDRVVDEEINIEIIPDESGDYCLKIVCEPACGALMYPIDKMTFDMAEKRAKKDFAVWQNAYEDIDANIYVVYNMWSNFAGRSGLFKNPTVLSSKAGMCAVWSWDNCFAALGLAKRFPKHAYNQFILPLRHLKQNGYMFDTMTDENIDYRFTKPPVHGFIYRLLMEQNVFFCKPEIKREAMQLMVKNTEWWLNARGQEPCYVHGNDSGIDNAVCFDVCRYVATPELYALLSEQCAVISEIAASLGLDSDMYKYKNRSLELAEQIDKFVKDGRLSVKSIETGEYIQADSLMLYRTLIAGKKLSSKAIDLILKNLSMFEADYGFASEALNSSEYNENGYWRGPVWAPDQVIFCRMLYEFGKKEYAQKMAEKFLAAVDKSGCYENYNAKTGEGYRCRTYTWSGASYIYLKDLFAKNT